MEAPLLVAALLLLSSTLVVSDFCVCRSDQPQASLQKTIDYACGSGADCNLIHEQGPCYNPNTVVAHCSWAANSYFQKKRAMGGTCDFTGTALLTTTDPSSSGCSYPQVQVLLEHQRLRPGLGLGLEAQQGEPQAPSRPVPAPAPAWEEPAWGRTPPLALRALGLAAWVQQARATWTRQQRACCIQGPERLPSSPCSSPCWHSREVPSIELAFAGRKKPLVAGLV